MRSIRCGRRGSGGVPGTSSPASGPAPVLQKVAYYEDPGILMIVQSVQDEEDYVGGGEGTGGRTRTYREAHMLIPQTLVHEI